MTRPGLQRYSLNLCLIKYELHIRVIISLLTVYFHLRVLCNSDLRLQSL